MKTLLKNRILLVEKNLNDDVMEGMVKVSEDDGKNLITCTVVSGSSFIDRGAEQTEVKEGMVIITGVYSLYKLMYKGGEYYFLDSEDIIGIIEE